MFRDNRGEHVKSLDIQFAYRGEGLRGIYPISEPVFILVGENTTTEAAEIIGEGRDTSLGA
jgi:hypothetical protein